MNRHRDQLQDVVNVDTLPRAPIPGYRAVAQAEVGEFLSARVIPFGPGFIPASQLLSNDLTAAALDDADEPLYEPEWGAMCDCAAGRFNRPCWHVERLRENLRRHGEAINPLPCCHVCGVADEGLKLWPLADERGDAVPDATICDQCVRRAQSYAAHVEREAEAGDE